MLPPLLRAAEQQRSAATRRAAREAALETVRACGVLEPIEALIDAAVPAALLEEALARFAEGLKVREAWFKLQKWV